MDSAELSASGIITPSFRGPLGCWAHAASGHGAEAQLATDCDREGQLIGQEILEHYEYRGQVMRVLFTAQDSQTIRDAFGRAKPNAEYARLYAAAVAPYPSREFQVPIQPRARVDTVQDRPESWWIPGKQI
jgi:hypothetical protein